MLHLSAIHRAFLSLALVAVLLAVSGCAHRPASEAGGLAPFPAVFAGALPCTDCSGIAYRLTLGADGDYVLTQRDHDRPEASDFVEVGRWQIEPPSSQLVLTPTDADAAGTSRWRLEGRNGLVAVGAGGQRIDANLDYRLVRQPEPRRLSLGESRWALINAPESALPQLPYVQFDDRSHRISGSTGCNRLMGGYTRRGQTLSFDGVATTRMACAGHDETEQSMLEALRHTTRTAILGRYLLLYGVPGNPAPLAVFHAELPAASHR